MPFDFHWHDPDHSIIRIDTYGETTWDEFTKAVDRIVEELSKTNHRIDVVFNNQTSVPKGNPLPHLWAAKRRIAAYDDHFGILITVGSRSTSSIIKAMSDIVTRVYKLDQKHRGHEALTMEQALEQIAKSRARARVSVSKA